MRKNWSQIFAAVPDIQAALLRSTGDGHTVWAEWEWKGRRRDGTPNLMRGVTIQEVQGGRIAWVRLSMEPVAEGGPGIDTAVRQGLAGKGRK